MSDSTATRWDRPIRVGYELDDSKLVQEHLLEQGWYVTVHQAHAFWSWLSEQHFNASWLGFSTYWPSEEDGVAGLMDLFMEWMRRGCPGE